MRVGITLKTVRDVARSLPGAAEGLSYQTPAFRVGGKVLCRMHEDGRTLIVHCDPLERELLLDNNPSVFFVTDLYVHHTWVLVRMETATRPQLEHCLRHAWRSLGGRGRSPRRRRRVGPASPRASSI